MSKTPKLPLLPLLAAPALLLAGCATADPLLPEVSRFERVPLPNVPLGEALCDDDKDGVGEPCLSQAQGDDLFNDTVDALCEANDRIAYLSDYFLGTTLGPSCSAAQ